MRLIDADELKIDFGFTWDDIAPTREEMFEIIDRQPTVDAVPVVRCTDCIHNSLNRKCGNAYCNLEIGLYQLDDYCSRGERRETDETD